MEQILIPVLKSLLLVPVTLLPIINPLSTAPVFITTVGKNQLLAGRLARQVAINSWFVIVTSMLIGTYVLALFGISLPVVRIGGGLLVASTAWRLLHRTDDDEVHAPSPALYLAGAFVAAAGAAIVATALYLIFRNSTSLVAWLGDVGMLVMTRLMAFILLCIGIQIMWLGWAELNGVGTT